MLDEREQLPSNTDMRQISVWIKCWCPFDLKRPQCDNGNQLDLLTLWYTCSEKKRSMRNGPCVHYVFRMKITAENACVQPWSGTEPELIRGLYQAFFLPFPLECAASWCVPADLKMLTVHIWVIKESLFTSNNLNPLKHCPESIVLTPRIGTTGEWKETVTMTTWVWIYAVRWHECRGCHGCKKRMTCPEK